MIKTVSHSRKQVVKQQVFKAVFICFSHLLCEIEFPISALKSWVSKLFSLALKAALAIGCYETTVLLVYKTALSAGVPLSSCPKFGPQPASVVLQLTPMGSLSLRQTSEGENSDPL